MDRRLERRPDVLAAQNAVSSMGRTRQLSDARVHATALPSAHLP